MHARRHSVAGSLTGIPDESTGAGTGHGRLHEIDRVRLARAQVRVLIRYVEEHQLMERNT